LNSLDDYLTPQPHDNSCRPPQKNRAEMIFFIGLCSIFICGPAGLAAWKMANSDLSKIRQGVMCPDRVGLLKAGRFLGVAGVAMFLAVVAASVWILSGRLGNLQEAFRSSPLPTENVAFVGEWFGSNGTLIRIRQNGSGDFRTKHKTVTGGRVSISDNELAISILGIGHKWRIEAPPSVKDGYWMMKLDGEVFRRKAEGTLV
jgi:hypothetical protein